MAVHHARERAPYTPLPESPLHICATCGQPVQRRPYLAVVTPPVEDLILVAAAHHGRVALDELLSPSRRPPVARARFVAMLVLNEGLGLGALRIGRLLARNPSSITYGLKRARSNHAIRLDAHLVRLVVDQQVEP